MYRIVGHETARRQDLLQKPLHLHKEEEMMEETGDAQRADAEFRRLCSDLTLQTKKDGFFKDYVATITDQVSPEEFEMFSKQKTDRDRVAYCWTLPAFHKTMPAIRISYHTKSTEESIKRRIAGNDAFQEKDYRKALVLYSQSVVHAPYNSLLDHTTLALALGNRSAALVHLKEYGTAVRDIQLALQSGYPENQKYKMYDRLGYCYQQLDDPARARSAYTIALDCLESTMQSAGTEEIESSTTTTAQFEKSKRSIQLSLSKLPSKVTTVKDPPSAIPRGQSISDPPTLLGGPHPNLPSGSIALTLTSDEHAGRYYKAAQDIKPGETLVYEAPYAACLLPDKFPSHCHHCFVRLIAPLGCTKCRGVAFCSIECRDRACSTYHQYECGVIEILTASGASILAWVALRIITQGELSTFQKLRPSLSEITNDFKHYPPNDYRSVYQLATLSHLRTSKDFFDRTLMALFLFQCLRATGYLNHQPEDPQCVTEEDLFIASLLLRHLQFLQFNAHEIHEFLQVADKNMRSSKSNYIGVGIYPTVAFFNHSCRPDVARYFIGTKLVICSSRSIQSGETIHENYGPIFTHKSRMDRQTSLKGRYWFTCQCLPCKEDWPQYDSMVDLESVLTCCPHCGGSVTKVEQTTYLRCLNCKKPSIWDDVHRPVEEMTNLYQTAMGVMDLGQLDKAVQLLGLFIDMMEAFLRTSTTKKKKLGTRSTPNRPVRELFLAQEALRLCFGTLGTKYAADSHLTLRTVRKSDK